MTYQDFYNDPTCVEEIHEGFVRLYLPSSEHRLLMVDVHAEFDDRRRTKEERCGSDPRRIHEYLSICNVDPIDHTVPVQISNFNHPTRSILHWLAHPHLPDLI